MDVTDGAEVCQDTGKKYKCFDFREAQGAELRAQFTIIKVNYG
jgi:hypothetical protein